MSAHATAPKPAPASNRRRPRRRPARPTRIASRTTLPALALALLLAAPALPVASAVAADSGGLGAIVGQILSTAIRDRGDAGQDAAGGAPASALPDLAGLGTAADQAGQNDQAAGAGEDASPAETLLRDAIASFATELTDLQDRGITVGELRAALATIERDPACDIYAGCTWTYREDGADPDACTVTAVELRYCLTDGQIATYRADWDAALARAVAAADGTAGTYEAVRAVHDYLATSCAFETESATAPTAYGALVLGQASNRGFADAFALVLGRLGVDALVVYNDTGVPWNMVQIDGAWYHVDVSWDAAQPGTEPPAVPATGYFLVDDTKMEQAHGSWRAGSPDAPAAPQSYGSLVAGTTFDEHVAFAKGLWRQAFDALQTEVAGLGMYGIMINEAYEAFEQLVAEEPVYDYTDTHGTVYSDSGIVSSLTCTYRLTPEEFADYAARREEAIAAALAAAQGLATPYEQVVAVHDYLVRTCAYGDTEAVVDHTAYSALLRGQAVCDGYSSAFRILMDRLGIPCITVASEDMAHSWNMVQLDGQWYHVDVTWDDPTPDRGPDAEVSHRFLLRGDDYMAANEHYGWESPYAAPSDYPGVG